MMSIEERAFERLSIEKAFEGFDLVYLETLEAALVAFVAYGDQKWYGVTHSRAERLLEGVRYVLRAYKR